VRRNCFALLLFKGEFKDTCNATSYIFRRYLNNRTLLSEIGRMSRNIPGARLAMGGNAPVIAHRLAIEGAEILLAARFTPESLQELPDNVKGIQV